MRHSCSVSSCTGWTSPYRPGRMLASFFPLIDVDRHTRSPHTMGLASPSPGTSAFHATRWPDAMFQVVGSGNPSAIPIARMPRNCGQSTPGFGVPAALKAMWNPANTTAATPAMPRVIRVLMKYSWLVILTPDQRSLELLEPLIEIGPAPLLVRDLRVEHVLFALKLLQDGREPGLLLFRFSNLVSNHAPPCSSRSGSESVISLMRSVSLSCSR